MTGPDDTLAVCVIGAGPRGLSVLERICANAGGLVRPVEVHLVDPYPPGAGAVWRTDQPGELLMNTVASQVTLFTDDSVPCAGPSVPGPSLYEWACAIREGAIDHDLPARALDEARRLGPDTYPTRAFHGHYLEGVFRHVLRTAPPHVTVHTHPTTAIALADDVTDGRHNDDEQREGVSGSRREHVFGGRQGHGASSRPQTVTLANGDRLAGMDAVVLALGHGALTPSPEERALRSSADRHGLVYVAPANPADADLSGIAPGAPVALRGLGLNFFDCLALLTEGRGGTFKEGQSGLVYLPSGNEPVLYAGSRRGVPYHARGENEKGALGRHEPRFLTPDVIAGLRRRATAGHPLSFRHDLWPLIDREVRTVYHEAWIRAAQGPGAAEEFVRSCPAGGGGGGEEAALLARHAVPPGERWDWARIERPYGERTFTDRADFRHWLLEYLRRDVAEARLGNVSGPLKAALDALRDLRNEIRLVVDHGGLAGESYRAEVDGWYTPLNAFTSIGPPAFRIEQLIALIEADVLQVIGPGMRVRARPPGRDHGGAVGERFGEGGFLVDAELVDEPPVRVGALIEARLPAVDLRRSADPLLRGLLAAGACTPYRLDGYEPGGLAVTDGPPRLMDTAGRAHPRRFAFGVPVEGVRWVTAVGVRPGVGSVTLEDSDAIARAVLRLWPAGAEGPGAEKPGAEEPGVKEAGAEKPGVKEPGGRSTWSRGDGGRGAAGRDPGAGSAGGRGPGARHAGGRGPEGHRRADGTSDIRHRESRKNVNAMSVGTDAGLLAPTWAGTPVAAEVTDEAWLQAMLDAEVALARAQHVVGLTPAAAVEAIASAARAERFDLVALSHAARAAANPVVALVTAFTEAVAAKDPAAAEYVHRGSTSQDILDSAAMRIARRVLDLIAADLSRVGVALSSLADTHRRTVMAGRTLAQHAVPTTFGLKAAGWLQLVIDALARVRAVACALPAQLGGAAGTLAAYREYAMVDRAGRGAGLRGPVEADRARAAEPRVSPSRAPDGARQRAGGSGGDLGEGGVELLGPFSEALGLAEPTLPWHTVRTPVAELGAVLQLVTGALGKFALDVQTLSRTEIGELSEPAAAGRGASSAMPQKRNPALATLIVSAARQVPAHSLVLAQCLLAEDERPAGAWHAEWQPLREALRLAGGAAHTAVELAEGLIVHPDRMRANLELTGGALVTERLTVALAPVLGKVPAKKLLTTASAEAADTGRLLRDVLAADPEVSARLTPAQLAELLDPARYTGAAEALIDRALNRYEIVRGHENDGSPL